MITARRGPPFRFFTAAAGALQQPAEGAEIANVPESRTQAPPVESEELRQRLTHDEDDELRRLNWISQIGSLSQHKRERLLELRLRDRRKEIRAPREFAEEKVVTRGGKTRKWYQFRSR